MAKGTRLRLLILEDEALVAMLIEDMVTDLGHDVIGPVGSVAQALAAVDGDDFDGALLDINLGGGMRSYAVADVLVARGIPIVFVTGYGTAGLDPRYGGTPVLQKPFAQDELKKTIERVFR